MRLTARRRDALLKLIDETRHAEYEAIKNVNKR